MTDNNLNLWIEKMKAYRFPRWNTLPEIDLYMDQLIFLLDKYLTPLSSNEENKQITSAMINNYVKQKIIAPPDKKKYSRSHIASLIMVCVLKDILPIPVIQQLITSSTEKSDMENVYDTFCSTQEFCFSSVFSQSNKETKNSTAISKDNFSILNYDNSLFSLALESATLAAASKMLAEQCFILHIANTTTKTKNRHQKNDDGEKETVE